MLCFSTKQALQNAIVHLKIFKIKLQLLVVSARAQAFTALDDNYLFTLVPSICWIQYNENMITTSKIFKVIYPNIYYLSKFFVSLGVHFLLEGGARRIRFLEFSSLTGVVTYYILERRMRRYENLFSMHFLEIIYIWWNILISFHIVYGFCFIFYIRFWISW